MSASAQVYYVTFVKGEVKLASTGKVLKISDRINHTDQLIFQDKDAKISCVSPTRGRFDISQGSAKQSKKSEWIAILKDALVPASPKRQFSTRDNYAKANDPTKPFPNNRPDEKVLLPEDEWITLNPKYKISPESSVMLEYVVNGKTITRKLATNGQQIQFSKEQFVNDRGVKVSPEKIAKVNLTYKETNASNEKAKLITRFKPILISVEEFKTQARLLENNLQLMKKSKETISKEIYEHFNSSYGYTNPAIFDKYVLDL
jgi:hypothetical protein